ncbi:MAG: hypothetical protein HY334_07595 [Armatimonadetes bacterium]|nr:hypothetical protein [Armatimonadota bacterium]
MRLRLVTCALAVLVAVAGAGIPADAKPAKPKKVKVYAQGQVYCPASVLVAGSVVIQAGRCYTLYVIREPRGTFLAFAAPQAFIPPGQIVRLTTPAGAKAKAKILYLVPIQTRAVLVPVNAMTPVAVRVEDFGPQVSIVLTSVSAPNVVLIFQVRL